MLLIPAIDLKDGQCVRLKQGDMDQSTVFGEDPAALAHFFLTIVQGLRVIARADPDPMSMQQTVASAMRALD